MKTEIEQRFEAEAGNLDGIRERFRARVVRWAYANAEIWCWETRRQLAADDDLLTDPKNAIYGCGYDALNRPIVLLHFAGETVYEPGPRIVRLESVCSEEFVEHQEDALEVLRIVWDKLDRLSRLRFRGKLLVEDKSVVRGFYQHTLTFYEGSKTKRDQSINNQGRVFLETDYGPHGEQTYFRVRPDGSRFQLYQPLPKGITVKSLKETVRRRLLELIPELVATAAIAEPIYCVALAYDGEGDDALPPIIGIGTESERQHWLAEHGKRAKEFMWNPAEFQHYEKSHTQLDDDVLEEACDYLNSKWAEGGSAVPAANLLVETAAALSQKEWPPSVQRTPDFVVFAVSFEGGGLSKSLKASLGPEKFALLKAKRLV